MLLQPPTGHKSKWLKKRITKRPWLIGGKYIPSPYCIEFSHTNTHRSLHGLHLLCHLWLERQKMARPVWITPISWSRKEPPVRPNLHLLQSLGWSSVWMLSYHCSWAWQWAWLWITFRSSEEPHIWWQGVPQINYTLDKEILHGR